jgi:hypothetical protein
MNWIQVAQHRIHWWTFAKAVTTFQAVKAEESLQ